MLEYCLLKLDVKEIGRKIKYLREYPSLIAINAFTRIFDNHFLMYIEVYSGELYDAILLSKKYMNCALM